MVQNGDFGGKPGLVNALNNGLPTWNPKYRTQTLRSAMKPESVCDGPLARCCRAAMWSLLDCAVRQRPKTHRQHPATDDALGS